MDWAMLRNPAYRGTACFGKTRVAPRQRVTRTLRMRGGTTTRNSANHERPREDWIENPVPPLVAEETLARAASARTAGGTSAAPSVGIHLSGRTCWTRSGGPR